MSDEIIQCVECGRTFTWSFSEQRYFRENHLDPPKRCRECRSHRRNERATGTPDASARRTPSTTRPRATLPPASLPTSGSSKDSTWQAGWPNPYWFYGLIAVFSTLIVASVIIIMLRGDDWFWPYLISINLVACLLYGFDKLAAQAKWLRVPERILIAPVLVFGFVGTEVGRRLFHHKVTDVEFRLKYWIAVGIEVLLIVAYFVFVRNLMR